MKNILDKYRQKRFTEDYKEKTLSLTDQLLLALVEEVLQNDPEAAATFARYEEQKKATDAAEKYLSQDGASIHVGIAYIPGETVKIPSNNMKDYIALRNSYDILKVMVDDYKEDAISDRETILELEKTILKLSRGNQQWIKRKKH